MALSTGAAKRLHARRFRRLLAIELGRSLTLESLPNGPLSRDVVRVWVDVPNAVQAKIEVRRTARALARQTVKIRGLSTDAAARLVAIVTSEMIRVQAKTIATVNRPTTDNKPSNETRVVDVNAEVGAAWTPGFSAPAWLSTGLVFGSRQRSNSSFIYGRWMANASTSHRWLEWGVGGAYHLPLDHPRWSLDVGARLGSAHIRSPLDATWSPTLATELSARYRPNRFAHIGAKLQPSIAFTLDPEAARAPKAFIGLHFFIATP